MSECNRDMLRDIGRWQAESLAAVKFMQGMAEGYRNATTNGVDSEVMKFIDERARKLLAEHNHRFATPEGMATVFADWKRVAGELK